jgi:hypothetical protein
VFWVVASLDTSVLEEVAVSSLCSLRNWLDYTGQVQFRSTLQLAVLHSVCPSVQPIFDHMI